MKLMSITKPNERGQIVIPKKIREALGIGADTMLNVSVAGKSVLIYPIEELVTSADEESSYLKILEKTKGKWEAEDWGKISEARKKVELTASKRRKRAW